MIELRHTVDTITPEALEQLYAEREQLLVELDGRSEEARERWIQKQLDETGLKAMDFRNGMTMEIEPAREMVAHWVGAARAMLGDAPNYSETPIEMEVKVGEDPQRFAFILQRVGKLTPHQARQQAEARAEKAERAADLVAHGYREAEAALERVRTAADQLADGTEAGFRAALAIRTALEHALDGTEWHHPIRQPATRRTRKASS